MTGHVRLLAAGVALAVGLTGAAQAERFDIFAASQDVKLEQVKHRHYRRHNDDWRKAAFAIGAIGAIAAGAAAASRDRYYYGDGDYYDDDGYEPRAYYYDEDVCDNPNRPHHYPAPPGC